MTGAARVGAVAACLPLLGLAACGRGERQDEDEPKGRFTVSVVNAEFPKQHKLAKPAELRITVKNVGDRTIPNVAVTVKGFERRVQEADLSDPERPIFLVNGGPIENFGGFKDSKADTPRGGDTAYVDTWALGRLRPGKSKTFRWSVTPVEGGPYTVSYRVAAGLDGKANAVTAGGKPATGTFVGTIQDQAPRTRVADDGETVVEGSR